MRTSTIPMPERRQRTLATLLFAMLVILFAVLLFAADALLLSMSASAQASATAPVRVALRGQKVEICDLVGAVRVVPSNGPEAEVIVTRGGRDAARLRLETDTAPGHSSLHVVYPGSQVVYPRMSSGGRTRLQVRSDGCMKDKGPLGGRHTVTVSRSGGGLEAWADLEIRLPRGRQLALGLGVGDLQAMDLECDLTLDVASAAVRVERVKGALNVDTGSGPVVVRSVEGVVLLDTGSGAVECTAVKGPRLSVDTGSGGVSGSGVVVDELLVDTGSGGIDLGGVQAASIRLDTGSGGVRIGLAASPRTLNADTGSGAVTIEGPAGLGARLSLETGSGSITSDFPITIVHKEHDSLEGSIGDGSGHIHVDTGSGAIRLLKR